MKPKCKALIPNKWYHYPRHDGTRHHACQFKAKRDGYCSRHHPDDILATLLNKQRTLEARLNAVRDEVAVLQAAQDYTHPLNPS